MSNATVCTIDDGTGMIDVKKFSDLEDEGPKDELALVDGLFVKVLTFAGLLYDLLLSIHP
jgi:hypothetical protein